MRVLQSFAFVLVLVQAKAQSRTKTVETDSGRVELHYFTTGQVSTKAWMDKDQRWGHSWAYDPAGNVIFDRQTRRVGGHASVEYRYHPNGGISRAEYSDAPDGGIQWYQSSTTFDEQGRQTGFSEQGWDNDGPMRPHIKMPTGPLPAPAVLKQEEVREQQMFTNEYFVVARTNCRIQLRAKQPSPAAKDLDATLLKGDTLRGGTYSMGERFDPPLGQVSVTATNRRGKANYKVLRTDSV